MANGPGRPPITNVRDRKWWAKIDQVESDGEWDHLLWIGDEKCDSYTAPKVTYAGKMYNVRRVLWKERTGAWPERGMEVVPECGEENCISPRHSILLSQSAAAKGRHSGRPVRDLDMESKPWLRGKHGDDGSKWTHYSFPIGQVAAYLAVKIKPLYWMYLLFPDERPEGWVEDISGPGVGDSGIDLGKMFGSERVRLGLTDNSHMRAPIQGLWGSQEVGEMIAGVLQTDWVRKQFKPMKGAEDILEVILSSMRRMNKDYAEDYMKTELLIRDPEDGEVWSIQLDPEHIDSDEDDDENFPTIPEPRLA